MRAKFKVDSKTEFAGGTVQLQLTPVNPNDGDPQNENNKFWNATPSGEIKMTIQNPEAVSIFKPGNAIYVDFSEASE